MKKTSSIWGGAFDKEPSELLQEINASISFDKKLYKEDIRGSLAHSKMLARQGIIKEEDAKEIARGLRMVEEEINAGTFVFRAELEDIHMNIENRLREIIGEPASKLHTGRSRNDQVATDFKLFILARSEEVVVLLTSLIKELCEKAEKNVEAILPGFTHLQPAQPVSFAHHLLAYVEMFARDKSRFVDLLVRHQESPLGAAALAGTPYNIDRHMTAEELGFAAPTENSLDSVSSRDAALEFLSNSAILMSNLSRFAEELVLWMSPAFSYVKLSDSYTTGSSIMPQKKNPDAAELVRGKTGRVYGNLVSLLTVMKALPLAYSKDMQEDKEPLFDSAETIIICLKVMAGMISDMQVNKDKMLNHTEMGYLTATDLADYLVQKAGVAFRDAHHITGQIVRLAIDTKSSLENLPLSEMQAVSPVIKEDVFEVLKVTNSLNSRNSYGGTSFKQVREALKRAKEKYL